MTARTATGVEIRPATEDDEEAILELLQLSMGWQRDERHAAFFRWKHRANPHGRSAAWVAADETGRVLGLRTFMRWRFVQAGVPVAAARAVDTATHPGHRGRGIFTQLTQHGLGSLSHGETSLVFNTPNHRSLPGYLKLGWQVAGRLPVAVRPRSPRTLARLGGARSPADRWSTETRAGLPAPEVLASPTAESLVWQLAEEHDRTATRAPRPDAVVRTDRTIEHLRWRYGFPPLHYRAMALSGDPAEGMALFRVRRRGRATEASVCEMLVPRRNFSAHRRLLGRIVRETDADHAVLLGRARPRCGTLPLPGQGPTLVCRPVDDGSRRLDTDGDLRLDLGGWDLSLGDIELF